jgi:hypothetical protein
MLIFMKMRPRFLFAAILLLSAVAVKAQMPLSFGQPGYRHFNQVADSNNFQKKWFLTKFAGISTGFVVFKGGSGSFLSAPVGVQLNRQLTNNVYAFANVSVAPTYFNFNSSFYQPGIGKSNGFMNPNKFEINPAAQIGLMYINPERTFSISGSIGVSRSNYYGGAYPIYNPANPALIGNNKQQYYR